MKEFEKWYSKTYGISPTFKEKATWIAALEWVAKKGMYHYGNDFLTDMNELSTDIRIELEHLDEHGHVIRDKDGRILH